MHKRTVVLLSLVLSGFLALVTLQPQHAPRVSAQVAVGTIAYVIPNDTTGDQIWLIEPDGKNNRHIYSTGWADPNHVQGISGLAWRPDAGELVFASDHEAACSWYNSDLYSILPDGSGYRRVTNAPACAGLGSYPKGTVNVTISNLTPDSVFFIYIQGAPGIQAANISPGASAELQFTNVADLGNLQQPVVAINGARRWFGGAAADVKAGQTVDAGLLVISGDGSVDLGAYRPAWRSDGSRVGYAQGCSQIYRIADNPPVGSVGQPLQNDTDVFPCDLAWGPTAGTASQILYFTQLGNPGIYLTTEGNASAGTELIGLYGSNLVLSLQYLPDASGFVFAVTDEFIASSNIYSYHFGAPSVIALTAFPNEFARELSISPDGQRIVFERAASLYGPSDLWTMGIDGSNAQLLVHNAVHPTWSQHTIQVSRKSYLPLLLR